MMREKVFNVAMWVTSIALTTCVVGGFAVALWGGMAWGTYGRLALAALLGWMVALVVIAAAFAPKSKR